jgi:hypothetical protein
MSMVTKAGEEHKAGYRKRHNGLLPSAKRKALPLGRADGFQIWPSCALGDAGAIAERFRRLP